MLRRNHEMHQTNFFGTDLLLQLDPNDPLLKLSTVIPWHDFDAAFSKHYTNGDWRTKHSDTTNDRIVIPQAAGKFK